MQLQVFKFTFLLLLTLSVLSCKGAKFNSASKKVASETETPTNEKTPCPTNQRYNEYGDCVPTTVGLPTNINVTPTASQSTGVRNPASTTSTSTQTTTTTTTTVNTTPAACTNGATNSPACDSCAQGFIFDGGACVKGCYKHDYYSWGLMFLYITDRCSAYLPKLREGQSQLINSDNGHPGYIRVSCVNSEYVVASEPAYQSHQDNDWQRYQVKAFFGQPLDIACHNEKILFQQPRAWESCETSSSATCTAAYGDRPTETNACWTVKVFMDDQGIFKTTMVNEKTVGQNFNTQYRVYIKTSKDNFAASYDITKDIQSGYGQAMNSEQPQDLYSGRPPGFSFIARKDMVGQQIKVFVEAKTFLNGQMKQSYTGETLIKVRDNSQCGNNFDGTGLANFAIGNSVPSETSQTVVRKGYPWPLHN